MCLTCKVNSQSTYFNNTSPKSVIIQKVHFKLLSEMPVMMKSRVFVLSTIVYYKVRFEFIHNMPKLLVLKTCHKKNIREKNNNLK